MLIFFNLIFCDSNVKRIFKKVHIRLFDLMIKYKHCKSTSVFQLEILQFPCATVSLHFHFSPVSVTINPLFFYTHPGVFIPFASFSHASCFLGEFAKLRKVTISFVMSVRLSAWNNSAPTSRIFIKFDI